MTNNMDRLKRIGKAMMIPLRYGGGNFSAKMDRAGFASLNDVLNHEVVSSLNAAKEELEAISLGEGSRNGDPHFYRKITSKEIFLRAVWFSDELVRTLSVAHGEIDNCFTNKNLFTFCIFTTTLSKSHLSQSHISHLIFPFFVNHLMVLKCKLYIMIHLTPKL